MVRMLNIIANATALVAGSVLLVFFSPIILAYIIYVYFFVRPVLNEGLQKIS